MTVQQNLDAIAVPDNWDLLDQLAAEAGEQVFTLFTGSGDMLRFQAVRPLYEVLEPMGHQDRLTLFLRSTGGIAEVPWKIVSLLREYAKHLTIIVPDIAHSGATHITLAADTLIMTELATLSSVDPTRRHPLLPKDKEDNPIPMSVQDLKHCVEFIKGQLGKDYSGAEIAAIIGELFNHVHPLALGAIEQSAELSKLVTRKVLATRQQALSPEQVEKIVEQLAGKYYSHVFPISRTDVERDLGLKVTAPSGSLKAAMEALLGYYEREDKHVGDGKLNGVAVRFVRSTFIDSQNVRKVCYAFIDPKGEVVGNHWKTIRRSVAAHGASGATSRGAPTGTQPASQPSP